MVLQQTKGFIMAKQRQQHSLVAAITACANALEIESIPNPTDAQLRQIHDAKVKAAGIIKTSNFITAGAHGDDAIETAHQVDAVFEQAGIDPVQFRRDGALAGAEVTVQAVLEAGEQAELAAGEQD
ncbi:MAG: hypothetical protein ACXQT0_04750 [Candidatus Methanofastidiosia archaeon]